MMFANSSAADLAEDLDRRPSYERDRCVTACQVTLDRAIPTCGGYRTRRPVELDTAPNCRARLLTAYEGCLAACPVDPPRRN